MFIDYSFHLYCTISTYLSDYTCLHLTPQAPEKKTYMVYNLIDKSVKSWESDYQRFVMREFSPLRYNISVNEILDGLEERFGFTEVWGFSDLAVCMGKDDRLDRQSSFFDCEYGFWWGSFTHYWVYLYQCKQPLQ